MAHYGLQGVGDSPGYDSFSGDYGSTVFQNTDGTFTVSPPDETSYTVMPSPGYATPNDPTPQERTAIITANPADPVDLSWLSKLADAVPKALQLYNAQQIAALNIERARAGRPPLNPGIYGPQVGVGLNPGTQNLVLYGALALGALMLLRKKGR